MSAQTEPELFTSVIEFANWPDLPKSLSRSDSKRLREGLRFHPEAVELWAGYLMNTDRLRWRPEEPHAERRRLRGILEKLIARDPQATRDVGLGIRRAIEPVRVECWPHFRERPPANHPAGEIFVPTRYKDVYPTFRFTATVCFRPASLEQWYSLAIAILLELDVQIGRCALSTCRRFFAALKKRGPPREYCSQGHGSQARVKRKRQRDARR